MAKREGARKTGKAIAVSTTPDVCKTPMGNSTPPIPYQITADFSDSASVSPDVRFGGDPAFILDQSIITKVTGDEPGAAGGVKSGTNKNIVEPVEASANVRVDKKRVVRHGDRCKMNNGNTMGKVIFQPGGGSSDNGNTPAEPETAEEAEKAGEKKGLWSKLSGVVHGALDAAGFIPLLGAVPDLANAGIYALEGNKIDAGISAVAAIPGFGDVVKGGALVVKGGKIVAKKVAREAAEKGAKELAEKAAKEAAEKAAKEAAEKAAKEKAAKTAAKKQGKENVHVKGKGKGPCDHLKKGKGKGKYRGGAHGETKKPIGDGLDSHHMPANDSSPLSTGDGPAVQMDPFDHWPTSSNGRNGPAAAKYRSDVKKLIEEGRWRDAMFKEIRDVRRVAGEGGNRRKYNVAMQEMLRYLECLARHGLLKGGLK